jgi:maltose O-acetyltransferase
MTRLDRYRNWISKSNPFDLENGVRALLIHYFFHVSDKTSVEVQAPADGGARFINALTPTVFKGPGLIRLAPSVVFGVQRSPGSFGCTYVEARTPQSLIEIGDKTVISNRGMFFSEGAHIRIGARCLFGSEVQVLDSNAHQLALGQRHLPDQKPLAVVVEDDVLVGNRVILLKGCHIGRGCVIAAGTVVPPKFIAPPLSMIAGNPARIVGQVGPEPQNHMEEENA